MPVLTKIVHQLCSNEASASDHYDFNKFVFRFRYFVIHNEASSLRYGGLPKRFSVAYEKLKVARVRLIDVPIINLVYDPMTQREPNAATGVIGRAHAFFRAGSSGRFSSEQVSIETFRNATFYLALFSGIMFMVFACISGSWLEARR
jgi:hypothetical protein